MHITSDRFVLWGAILLLVYSVPLGVRSDIVYSGRQDIVISNRWWNLDFNSDSVTDLMISHTNRPDGYYSLRCEVDYFAFGYTNRTIVQAGSFSVAPLPKGYSIDAEPNGSFEWYIGGDLMYSRDPSGIQSMGLWHGASNGYVALEFLMAGSVHYGWACLSVETNHGVAVLHDYAYEDQAGQGIPAGAIPEPQVVVLLALGLFSLVPLAKKQR